MLIRLLKHKSVFQKYCACHSLPSRIQIVYSPVRNKGSFYPFAVSSVKEMQSGVMLRFFPNIGGKKFSIRQAHEASSEPSSDVDPNELIIDDTVKVPLWEYLSKHPPRNVYAETDQTFMNLLKEGKVQLRFLIPQDVVETLALAGDVFLNSLKEHNATLKLTNWKLPEGILTLECPIDSAEECFNKIRDKLADEEGKIRLLLHDCYSYLIMGINGAKKKELMKENNFKADKLHYFKQVVPFSTDRCFGIKGDEKTLLLIFNHIIKIIKENSYSHMEIPFNKGSHVGALVEKYGGFGVDYTDKAGSRDDGKTTARFSIPKELATIIKEYDGEFGTKGIRNLSGATLKLRNPNNKKPLTSLKVIGLPIQIEQVCYMLKQSLEKTDDGKTYLRGEWKHPQKEDDDDH